MKVLVRGNTVMVQTNIKEEDYEKFKGYGVFVKEDYEGDETFRVVKSTIASMSTFGLSCNTVHEEKLAASFIVDSDMDEFLIQIKPAMLALKEAEEVIAAQVEAIKERLQGLDELIERE